MPPKKGELTVNAETEEQLIEYLKKPGITLVEVMRLCLQAIRLLEDF